jgi:membrane-associated PAP2 superfamily phosphatase
MNDQSRKWLREAGLFCAIAAVVTIIFAVTPLDIAAARIFYDAQGPDHWPLATQWPWSALYRLAPYITASLLAIGVLWLFAGYFHKRGTWRENGIFLIFCVLIGPGLLINAVFKDHWDRPRPRDVVEFGGTLHYKPAPWPGGEGGGSFPCGHCSVGFLYASGWWIWRRRHPGRARASLAIGLALGSALGLGRMAAGAHFFSDVVWSALLALGLAHVLSRSRERTRRFVSMRVNLTITALALTGAAMVVLALFVTPHGKPFSMGLDPKMMSRPPQMVEVTAPNANIDIVIGDSPKPQLLAQGELHGFGWPGSLLEPSMEFHALPIPAASFRIKERGWITDLSAWATLMVSSSELQRIVVRLQKGNIQITDETRARVICNGTVQLDLHTDSGTVRKPEESSGKCSFLGVRT